MLIAHKADVNATDNDGLTPLHAAVSNGHKEVAALLLSSNALVNTKDHNGHTPLDLALTEGYKDIAELLVANKARRSTPANANPPAQSQRGGGLPIGFIAAMVAGWFLVQHRRGLSESNGAFIIVVVGAILLAVIAASHFGGLWGRSKQPPQPSTVGNGSAEASHSGSWPSTVPTATAPSSHPGLEAPVEPQPITIGGMGSSMFFLHIWISVHRGWHRGACPWH